MKKKDNPDILGKFKENSRDFIKKHGMSIAAGIFLCSNGILFTQPLWDHDPEHYNLFRNTLVPLCQFPANYYFLKKKKDSAYTFSTGGALFQTIAAATDKKFLAANFITWGLAVDAAYQASKWPQRIHNGLNLFRKEKKEAPTTPQQSLLMRLTNNRLGAFNDPHARAGLIAFSSTVIQGTEALFKQNASILNVIPFWLAATGIYLANGLILASENRKKTVEPIID